MAVQTIFIGLAFSVLISPSLSLLNVSQHCAESCMQINPYNSDTAPPVRHCARLTQDGQCECDWEKVLDSSGECRCRSPHHQPDPVTGRCGEKKCPEDSDMEEGECECLPCQDVECQEGKKAVITSSGDKKPGNCCDTYKCVDKKRPCISNSTTYSHGYTWYRTQTCEKCTCNNGIFLCDLQENCTNKTETHTCFEVTENTGKVYNNGDFWMRDSCTSCVCKNGTPECISHFCQDASIVTHPNTKSCMPMDYCKKNCILGYKLNKKGCETCKCKVPDKKIADIMKANNCTLENCDLIKLLTSSFNQSNDSSDVKATDYHHVIYIPIIFVLAMTILVLLYCVCKYRKRGDLSISHFQMDPRTQYQSVPPYKEHEKIISTLPTVESKNLIL